MYNINYVCVCVCFVVVKRALNLNQKRFNLQITSIGLRFSLRYLNKCGVPYTLPISKCIPSKLSKYRN